MQSTNATFHYCPRCSNRLSPATIDGLVRPRCPCGFVFFDNPIPVVAALVECADGVILVRGVNWPRNWFGLVSGFIERNELPAAAVLREVQEELGVNATIQSLIGHYVFAQKNELIIAYHVFTREPITLGSELESYKRVPIADLRPWNFGTGLAVADWLRQRSP